MHAREIGNEEYVSQYGSRLTGQAVFWDCPRPQDRDGLSAIIGKVTPGEARKRVRRAGSPTEGDGVRYALVGDLRDKGFRVIHTPRPGNTMHVSVSYPSAWDDHVAGNFNVCFSDPQWHEEPRGGPR